MQEAHNFVGQHVSIARGDIRRPQRRCAVNATNPVEVPIGKHEQAEAVQRRQLVAAGGFGSGSKAATVRALVESFEENDGESGYLLADKMLDRVGCCEGTRGGRRKSGGDGGVHGEASSRLQSQQRKERHERNPGRARLARGPEREPKNLREGRKIAAID
jgi:hypothetical protein